MKIQKIIFTLIALTLFLLGNGVSASIPPQKVESPQKIESLRNKLINLANKPVRGSSDALIFDLPVTYNAKVSKWISYYQGNGRRWFREWLERSTRFMPYIQTELKRKGLPLDLGYMAMIESGFSAQAVSHADAVGPWQFIEGTGSRYGLKKTWWLDERRDFGKSTQAATKYLSELYKEFGSWYLVAASYNMGESGLRRQINKYKTKDYWTLIKLRALPVETQEYVPKILAAMLISKAPNLYGFRDVERQEVYDYDIVSVPGGTDIAKIADFLGVTKKSLMDLNAELVVGYIPRQIENHYIRVPKGAGRLVGQYIVGALDNRRQSIWE